MIACKAQIETLNCPQCAGIDIVTRPGDLMAAAQLCPHLGGCAACRDTGFRRVQDAEGYEAMQPCALIGLKRRVELFNRAGVPTRYHDSVLDAYENRGGNQAQVLMRFAKLHDDLESLVLPGGRLPRAVRGIGLAGPPGTGKTHLLAAMARHLVLDLGVPVRFVDFSRLLWDLKAGFEAKVGEDALIAPLVEVEVLLIDELGKGRASEWEISILDALVSERYNRKLMTFFATNHPLVEQAPGRSWGDAHDRKNSGPSGVDGRFDSLASRTHPRIVSRLSEMCDLLTIEGPDSRLLAASSPRPTAGKR